MVQIYHRVVDWEKKSTMYLEIAAKLQNLTITPENQNSNLRETHEKSPIQIISQSSIGPRDYYALKLLAYLSGKNFRCDSFCPIFLLNTFACPCFHTFNYSEELKY